MTRLPMRCHVCGDIARGFNFNLITCMSCKTFFRRNVHRRMYMRNCRFNNNCRITETTRSFCSPCRLEKCLARGMDPRLIRCIPKYPRDSNKISIPNIAEQIQPQLSTPRPCALDLLDNDRSTLTSEQWNLISNIIHVYDEQLCIVQIKSLINQLYSVPLKLRSKLVQTSNIIGQAYSGVQTLVERSSHLQSLSNDSRRALVKHNMYITGAMNSLFLFRELDVYSNVIITNVFYALYSPDIVISCVQNSNACDSNGILIKIFIFVLVFSSNCSPVLFNDQEDFQTMSSSLHLIEIQNIYITTLWKYLVYLYGHDEAVLRFSGLIKRVLNMLHLAELILDNTIHSQVVNTLVTTTEHALIIKN